MSRSSSQLDAQSPDWWRGAVVYQIYPRSFLDTTGNGVGDLAGIASRLDYVADLGVDAVWLSPFFTSPGRDFGYDVADYRNVDPLFGTLRDADALIERAHSLGLRVIIDLVFSHSSEAHPHFLESRNSRDGEFSDWYVWADAKPDGTPPNNWLSLYGGPAWTWEPRRGQYYLHNFLSAQPDFNCHNPEVRTFHLDNLRFWLDRGVDGVRLDVINFSFHSLGLEDNPPFDPELPHGNGTSTSNPYSFQNHVYDKTRPEVIPFLNEIRSVLDEYPGSTSVGEITSQDAIAAMSDYTQGTDRLHMAYTFDLFTDELRTDHVSAVARDIDQRMGTGWPCWALSNHDVIRCPTRWGNDHRPAEFARVALAFLLSLRGSITVYQGEELGLPSAEVPYDKLQDPYGRPFWPHYKGRDTARTPMPWVDERRGGFSTSEPWLPLDPRHVPLAVQTQQADPASTLRFVRRLLTWRASVPELIEGEIEHLEPHGQVVAWVRHGERSILAAFNLGDRPEEFAIDEPVARVLEGHGFESNVQPTSDGAVAELPPFQALYAELGDSEVS